jgi:hypothetical protein
VFMVKIEFNLGAYYVSFLEIHYLLMCMF